MGIAIAAGLSGMGLAGAIIFKMPAWQTIGIIGFATLSYTMIGGFRASIVAGKIQTLVILPLFALLAGMSVFIMGDFSVAWHAANIAPIGWPDFDYGLGLLIGVICAEAFDQMWWQHVYSGAGERAMRRGFFITGFLVFPVVLIAGLIGVYVAVSGASFTPSTAVFDFIATMPPWLSGSAMVLAIALVMGNTDSLLNGMVSIVTVDIKRLRPGMVDANLLRTAKILTAIFALVAMAIATLGFGVLYLFLVADLICAGAAFPVFYGLFSPRVGKRTALIASVLGILSGLLLFPDPSFTRGDLGLSFLVALIVPAVIVVGYRTAWRTSSSS
jgi:Na+/proline symporter